MLGALAVPLKVRDNAMCEDAYSAAVLTEGQWYRQGIRRVKGPVARQVGGIPAFAPEERRGERRHQGS